MFVVLTSVDVIFSIR